MNTLVDRCKLYDNSEDFFNLNGNVIMRLTPDVAKEVCDICTKKNIAVGRIEGGIWHNPGFEARIDCIWAGLDYTTDPEAIVKNNLLAKGFIDEEREAHDIFIITAMDVEISDVDL